jgi:hypothetical protein
MGDGGGRTRQRVWNRGARNARQGDFGIGEEMIPEVVRKIRVGGREGKSGWVEEKTEMRWFLLVRTAISAGLDL